ncbi:hypothetical protein LTR64_008839 [Lithohypha guttulata]|uniref:uncharacterized protein n=1 Tax=Lithohypha guttulata TaxID=1690604 RepID=UPI00315DC303
MLQPEQYIEDLRHTRLKRTIVLALDKFVGRWCRRSSRVTFLPGDLCIKSGHAVRLTEALTMEYVRKHTTIPVPKVFCAFEHHGAVYIAMERLAGQPLGWEWARRSDDSKAYILQQLRDYVVQLRNLPRMSDCNSVAAIDDGPFLDERLPGSSSPVGPFPSVKQFHRYLRSDQETDLKHNEDVQRLVKMHDDTSENVCFTHNDLSSFNILVDGQQITGIIDWEYAAWLPSYWEYTSAWHVSPQNMFWRDEVGKFLDVYEKQLEMEKIRRQWFGDY